MPSKNPELSIHLISDLVVLTPNIGQTSRSSTEHGRARHDTTLKGTVKLSLPKEAKFKRIVVELHGSQQIVVKKVFHAYDTYKEVVQVSIGDETLLAGIHEFAFEFIVPADAAPLERCEHGRTDYKVLAKAYAGTKFQVDLSAEQKVSLITNHSEEDIIPPAFNAISKSSNEHLGIVGINLTSQFLLVAGYLRIAVDIPEAIFDVRVEDIQVKLLQTWTLQSLQEESRTEEVPATEIPLWSLRESAGSTASAAAGTVIHKGSRFAIERRIVFPENDLIRPSTSKHSKTGLRASHKISVAVIYTPLLSAISSAEALKQKEVYMTHPAVLSSCCCVVEALQLPAYGNDAELQAMNQKACDARAKALFG